MDASLHAYLIDHCAADWSATIDEIRRLLGAPDNPTLLPGHFLKTVLPKLGGKTIGIEQAGRLVAFGFLFPLRLVADQPLYTLRYHPLPASPPVDPERLVQGIAKQLQLNTLFYDPSAQQDYQESHRQIGQLDFGHPGAEEVEQVRTLQQQIWNNPPDLLYPIDIHSVAFSLPTSIIARDEGSPVAFLFGFLKFGGAALPLAWQGRLHSRLRLESQTMGVSPAQRGRRIAYTFKQLQAEAARRQGIDIINWTADPLQYPNAALNFSSLRAVAYEFAPNLYELHNDLNQVSASRFSLTWLVNSDRVRKTTDDPARTGVVRLDAFPEITRINDRWHINDLAADAPMIAIEIPANWSQLQRTNLAEAQVWRTATDQIFERYVGSEPGQYVITAVGVDGDRRYLLGESVDETLLDRLIH